MIIMSWEVSLDSAETNLELFIQDDNIKIRFFNTIFLY